MDSGDEYLTIEEVAALLKKKPLTIRKKMRQGVFVEGVHFFRPPRTDPLFKRARLIEWIEGRQKETGQASEGDAIIPMRRGYNLVI